MSLFRHQVVRNQKHDKCFPIKNNINIKSTRWTRKQIKWTQARGLAIPRENKFKSCEPRLKASQFNTQCTRNKANEPRLKASQFNTQCTRNKSNESRLKASQVQNGCGRIIRDNRIQVVRRNQFKEKSIPGENLQTHGSTKYKPLEQETARGKRSTHRETTRELRNDVSGFVDNNDSLIVNLTAASCIDD